VTEDKSPGDRLLELVVFGPAGLAVTIVEEFPKLVEKGRHRVEGQVHTARLVGQFAVQMGRRQLEQSLGHLGARRDHVPERGADDRGADDRGGPGQDPGAEMRPPDTAPPRRDEPEPVEERRRPPVWLGAEVGNGSGSPSSLAIPGYDSLSASQVVQRLEGLSFPELEEVRAHEAAHRRRRTILHRVEQLLAGGDGP
jgi:hypothetical protein